MNTQRYLLQVDCVRAKRGGHSKPRTGARFVHTVSMDDLPQRESMVRRHRHNRKSSNGKTYGVIKQFLRGRIGQNWNSVYSELCQKLRRHHELDAHAREWVNGLVLQNVRIDEAGQVREEPTGCALYGDFYVHPETGTLQYASRKKRWKYVHKPLVETKKVDGAIRYAKHRGIWYEVTLLPIPTQQQLRKGMPATLSNGDVINPEMVRRRAPVDVILGERAMAENEAELQADSYWATKSRLRGFRAAWGGFVYAARKLQMNGAELAREGLHNDPMA